MDLNARLSLIQLYCLDADWQKALAVTESFLRIAPDDHVVALLKNNILAENKREQVLQGKMSPLPYAQHHFSRLQQQLLQNYLADHHDALMADFDTLIQETDFVAKITTYDERVLQETWIDSDFRLASVLEIFVQDSYNWLPLNAVSSIAFWDHEILTDVLWRRAHITLRDGERIAAFVPARYPTERHQTDLIKLNKMTEWQEIEGLPLAKGQKMLTSGETDIALLDVRTIQRD